MVSFYWDFFDTEEKMKKILGFICVLSIIFGSFKGTSYATEIPDVDICVNGALLDFEENVFLKNGLTYVPLREFFENLGISVQWDEESRTAVTEKGENYLKCYPDAEKVSLNGIENENIEFENGKIYISLRNASAFLDGETKWYDDIYVAQITTKTDITVKNQKNYTKDDLFWMTKIINAESAGEPIAGKIAVGNVILNRVESEDFPNSIYGVIFDKKYGVQFEPIINGSIYNDHTLECIIASKRAFSGENYVGNSLYFLNPSKASNTWIPNNREFLVSISNHDFYL